ncbi:MAG: methyltransferase domain-containing protein [Thermodesulfobacteriota bacterium]
MPHAPEAGLFALLEEANARPEPFSRYTARDLWTDEHTSAQMLAFHLDGSRDISSRKTAFIDRSADWMASRFGIGPATRVADFGCGPGLYTIRLARRGARVTGIDFSERSLAHARQAAQAEGLDIAYVHQDYMEFESPERFDLLCLIMCDFCALGPVQRQGLLTTFRSLIAPGGRLLLDVYSLRAFALREEHAAYAPNLLNGFWSPRPYYGFLNIFCYNADKVVLDKYTIVEPDRVRTVYNWLQHFDLPALEGELAASGWRVEEALGDVAGAEFDPEAPEFAVVAVPA